MYNNRFAASVRNTIIAANLESDGGVNPDVSGTFTSNGYNLIGDSTGSTGLPAQEILLVLATTQLTKQFKNQNSLIQNKITKKRDFVGYKPTFKKNMRP